MSVEKLRYINTEPQPSEEAEQLVRQLGVETAVGVQHFHASLPGYAPTALYDLRSLASELGVKHIFIKDESTRFGLKAFKALGGSYAMAQLLGARLGLRNPVFEELLAAKAKLGKIQFVSVTDGNHGRGVAWMAHELGYRAQIYMPAGTVQARVDNITQVGGEVTVTSMNYDETVRYLRQEAEQHGWVMVQDTDWPGYEAIPLNVMQGYTTMAKELVEQLGGEVPTHVLLQAGVGSMAAAVVAYLVDWYRSRGYELPRFIIVEPTVAGCYYATAAAGDGRAHSVGGAMSSMMAGLCCGEPCAMAWTLLRAYAGSYVVLEDELDAEGMRRLAHPLQGDTGIESGESGAAGFSVGLAALTRPELDLRRQWQLDASSVLLCINTEGATDGENYAKVINS